jgi:membrane protein YdbS with pleckstrin-like domain
LVRRFWSEYARHITKRRILYWLAVAVVLLVVGTIIGLIWADTSDVAGLIAGVTNVAAGVAIVCLLIAFAVVTRRQRRQQRHPNAA